MLRFAGYNLFCWFWFVALAEDVLVLLVGERLHGVVLLILDVLLVCVTRVSYRSNLNLLSGFDPGTVPFLLPQTNR